MRTTRLGAGVEASVEKTPAFVRLDRVCDRPTGVFGGENGGALGEVIRAVIYGTLRGQLCKSRYAGAVEQEVLPLDQVRKVTPDLAPGCRRGRRPERGNHRARVPTQTPGVAWQIGVPGTAPMRASTDALPQSAGGSNCSWEPSTTS